MNRFFYWLLAAILVTATVQAAWLHDGWMLAAMLVALGLLRVVKGELTVERFGGPVDGERLFVTRRLVVDDDGARIWAPDAGWQDVA